MLLCLCSVFQLDPQTVQSKNWHMDVIEMNGVRHKQVHSARDYSSDSDKECKY